MATFKRENLDLFLSYGYYRQLFTDNMFTTEFVDGFPVYWIRYRVNDLVLSKSLKKLVYSTDKYYVKNYRFLKIDENLQLLFDRYKNDIAPFNGIDSLAKAFDPGIDMFDTQLLTIEDCGKLIAAGIFDRGKRTIASILNYYHPDYKKCSLGLYLLIEEINYCIRHGFSYCYPGYISPYMNKFNYKLRPDKNAIEVYDVQNNYWLSYKESGLASNFDKSCLY